MALEADNANVSISRGGSVVYPDLRVEIQAPKDEQFTALGGTITTEIWFQPKLVLKQSDQLSITSMDIDGVPTPVDSPKIYRLINPHLIPGDDSYIVAEVEGFVL